MAIFGAFLLVVVVFGLFVTLFIPLFSDQITVLQSINFDEYFDSMMKPVRWLEDFLISHHLTASASGFIVDFLRNELQEFVNTLDFSEILNHLVSFTGSFFIGVLAVCFITFFLLYENGILRRQMISIVPNQYFEVFISALYKIEQLLSNFLWGILFQMIAIFTLASFGLSVVGVNYALTIAVFAAVANLIPYLGPLIGGLFGIIVALSTSQELSFSDNNMFLVIKVFVVFAIVQVIDNVLLQPLIFSKSVKAHPLEIFVIIFVAATIGGIMGMVVAIPVYTVLRVTVTEVYTGFNQYKVFKIKN